jgi:regulator of sigma E protease
VTLDGILFWTTAIVATILIIGILVLAHEAGHFVTARLAGIRVLEFGIGFPPRARVLGRDHETEYTLNYLPIGGFVRMEGEDAASDDPRSFSNAPLTRQLVVLAAGVVMNLVAAFLLFFVVAWLLNPSQVLNANYIVPGGAADRAGIPAGSRIESVDGQHYGFMSSQSLRDVIAGDKGTSVEIGYVAPDGSHQVVQASLGTDANQGILGVSCLPPTAPAGSSCNLDGVMYSSTDPGSAAAMAADQTWTSLQLIGQALGSIAQQVASNPGQAPAGLSGPVGITQTVGIVLTDYGPALLLLFAALLSANVALINILPIPPFDGGKMVIMVVKRAFGVRAVTAYEIATNLVGFALLILFVVWISYFDILRLGSGG